MAGIMLKKNKFFMKQERNFYLYLNGELKYFKGEEQKGTMKLVPGKRAYKDGKNKCTIPSATKDYLLY
jgi:hypothetical protein